MATDPITLEQFLDIRLAGAQARINLVRVGVGRGLVGATVMDIGEFLTFLAESEEIIHQSGMLMQALADDWDIAD